MRGGRTEAAAVSAIVLIALVLRLSTRTSLLPPGINADEYAWTWAGQSVLLDHSPSSWSYLIKPSSCPCVADPATGKLFPYVHPWLDHPPLFAMAVGSVALAAGETTPASVTAGVIRLVPDVLSVLTLALGYILARRLGRTTALLFTILFAFAPTMIIAASLVEAEWLLAPLMLGALLLARARRGWLMTALLLLCVLAPLVKETGVVVPLAVAAVLGVERRWRLAAGALAGGAIGVALVLGWAWLVDWSRFLAVLHAQSARHGQPGGGPLTFLLDPRAGYGERSAFADPLWYVGLAGVTVALGFAVRRRTWGDHHILVIPLAVTAAVMALTAPATAIYNGWYRIAVYPLVYLAAAWLIVRGSAAAGHRLERVRVSRGISDRASQRQ